MKAGLGTDYSFRQKPPFPAGSVYDGWGASHFAELWYVFDHEDQSPWNWTPGDRKLAQEMSTYWSNFASSGNPNISRDPKVTNPARLTLPAWPPLVGPDAKVLYLTDPITVGRVASSDGMKIFDTVYAAVRGSSPVPQ